MTMTNLEETPRLLNVWMSKEKLLGTEKKLPIEPGDGAGDGRPGEVALSHFVVKVGLAGGIGG